MGPFDQSIPWSTDGLVGAKRFLEKVWRVAGKCDSKRGKSKASEELEILMNKTTKKVGEDIENMRFNTAISTLMIAVNDMDASEEIPKNLFEKYLKILSPFAPHIAEELWEALGNKKPLVLEPWPKYDESKLAGQTVTIVVQVNGKVRGQFSSPIDIGEQEALNEAKNLPALQSWLLGKEIRKTVYVKGRLVNFVI
jgi:leucyl-tRNA synthetase